MKTLRMLTACVLFVLFVFAPVMPAFAEGEKTISEVRLTITEPKAGQAITNEIVSSEPEKYSAKVRYWINQRDSEDPLDAFQLGGNYTVVFEVTAANGFQFETPQFVDGNNKSTTKVFVNGKEARCVSWESDKSLVRAYDAGELKEEIEENTNFFSRILNAIKEFFAGIINFFRNLF